MKNGNATNANPLNTMIGNAIYKPTSNASERLAESFASPPLPIDLGMTPPNVDALISSSVASHDFIFSSNDNFAAAAFEDAVVVEGVSSSSSVLLLRSGATSRCKRKGEWLLNDDSTRWFLITAFNNAGCFGNGGGEVNASAESVRKKHNATSTLKRWNRCVNIAIVVVTVVVTVPILKASIDDALQA